MEKTLTTRQYEHVFHHRLAHAASVNLNYVSNGKQKRIHCKSFLSFTMKHIAIYFGVRKMDGVCYIHCSRTRYHVQFVPI